MAQTRRKRRRKHRGTPAGTVERAGRTGRPRTKEEAKSIARHRRAERLDRPPTWKSAAQRAALAAALFGVLVAVLRHTPAGLAAAPIVFLVYVPLGYGTDLAIHRFRQRRKAAGARK